VVVDEAHILTNMDTSSHTTITWLKSRFIIMATATVLSNRIDDFTGHIKFIEPTRDLWTDENMAKWNIDRKTTNPFALPDDHPASVLRITTRAVQKWITDKGSDQNKTGYYHGMIWKRIMIRGTYASPNPADPSRKIGQLYIHIASHSNPMKPRFSSSLEEARNAYPRWEDSTGPEVVQKSDSLLVCRTLSSIRRLIRNFAISASIEVNMTRCLYNLLPMRRLRIEGLPSCPKLMLCGGFGDMKGELRLGKFRPMCSIGRNTTPKIIPKRLWTIKEL
jgi:hypothetical protein